MGKFNLLKDAYYVKNTTSCRYDSLNGYTTDFSINGDVDGWDIYSGICMYGVWSSVMFGTSTEKSCFIGRSNPFVNIQAEKYYMLKINMKLTLPDDYGKKTVPTKGKVMWTKVSDSVWLEDQSKEFELNITDQWNTYIINLGEAKYWIGDINNLRIYPFTDGFEDIKFMIKSIVIDSVNDYTCLNTQCSFHSQFSHPCPGIGRRASVTTGVPKTSYTTLSDVSDTLILNIDGYGEEHVKLGNNENLSGTEMAKILIDRISRVNVGSYAYVEASYQEEAGTLSIFSGAMIAGSSITVSGTAAQALGFIDENGENVSSFEQGIASETGFDFGSSRRLKGFELNALVDSNTDKSAYYHNPDQYNVEAGRRDFADSMSSNSSAMGDKVDYYTFLEASQKLIIDASHPINDSGRLSKIWVNGDFMSKYDKSSAHATPKIYILRPNKYNQVEVIHELLVSTEEDDLRYTVDHVTFRVDCNVAVNKGDLVGFFNMKILAPFSARNQAVNGVYFEVPCGSSGPASGKFSTGPAMSQGVIGLSFYARSDRIQKEIQLDIDIGERTNLNEISVYGKEFSDAFEYNIACCLDMNWQVELYNGTHWHSASNSCLTVVTTVQVEHRNKTFGVECLSDCMTTADGGQSGTSYTINSLGPYNADDGFGNVSNSDPDFYSGIETFGEHSYFYVNGDAEWLNGGCCDGEGCSSKRLVQAEFKDPWIASVYGFEFDPISFYLIFPNDKWLDVHRSTIYFKETNNFKRYSLSYYLGETGPQGNAEETHFNYVPSYNSVTMDGLEVKPSLADGNALTQIYSKTIFKNPVPWGIPEYRNGVCTNWDIYQTIMNLEYNILQHDFDPISCRGFKIHTTWHKSTKLTEIELYSKIPVEPTLLDNVRIQSSVYGDYWNELSFTADEIDDERINAYVSSNPRYFRLQIQSQDVFELKELSASLSEEHIKSLKCGNIVLQDNAPKYKMSGPKMFEVENTYDIPLDLSIDIPRQLFRENYVLSWIRFDSDDTAFNGEIGPGAIIRKSDDHQIYLGQGQVAINTPSYYLKNLVDGKDSYVYENEHEWSYYKTLYHGEDVDYSNVTTGKVTNIGFLPVSSKFWKLCIYEPESIDITNLKLFFNSDSTITPVVVSNDFNQYDDGDYMDWDLWGRQDVPIKNHRLEMEFLGDGENYHEVRSNFFLEGDFVIEVDVTLHAYNTYGVNGPEFKFFSASDTSNGVLMQWRCPDYYGRDFRILTKYQGGSWIERTNSGYYWGVGNTIKLRCTRTGNTWGFGYYNGTNLNDLGSYTFDVMSRKVYFAMDIWNSNPNSTTSRISFDNLNLVNGYAFLGDLDSSFLVTNPVDVHKVHIQAEPNEYSGKFETSFDSENHVINPAILIEDDFSDGIWYDKWDVFVGENNSTFVEKNNAIYPFITAGDLIYFEKSFLPGAVSYEAEIHFNLDFPTTMGYFIEFINPEDEVSFKLSLIGDGSNGASLKIETITPPYVYFQQEAMKNSVPYRYKLGSFTRSVSTYTEGFKFTCSKSYKKFNSIKLTNTSGSRTFYSGTDKDTSFDRISKIRISYLNTSSSNIYDQLKDYGTKYVKFSALPKLSDLESIVFEFDNSQPLDALRLVQTTSSIDYPAIWLSVNDNNDYYIWAKNFTKTDKLSIPNHSFFGDNCYVSSISYYPYDCLDDGYGYAYCLNDYEHFLAYDFGAGNKKNISYIYYKSGHYYTTTYSYGEDDFKICRIYGSNSYKTHFTKWSNSIRKIRIDLSDSTLLKEFTINHNNSNSAYNTIYLSEHDDYRYLIFHYPYRKEGATNDTMHVEKIELYEYYNQVPSSNIVLSNSNYTNYLAINLKKPHNLDFIRNYGSKSNLLNLYNQSYLDYSSTDTNDINEVSWKTDVPSILLKFNDKRDSVDIDRYINTNGYIEWGISNGPVGGEYGWIGPRITTLYAGEHTGTDSNTTGVRYPAASVTFSSLDASAHNKSNTKLVVELRVDDINNFDGGQFEFSSYTSGYDVYEWNYSLYSDPLNIRSQITSEYKEFHLPLSYFDEPNAAPQMNQLKRIRFYIRTISGGNTIGFRNARLQYLEEDCYIYLGYNSSDMRLRDYNFTIDFWAKRYRENIEEGILGHISEHSLNSAFSFTYDVAGYLVATFYSGGTIYELKSIDLQDDKDWHHIAVVRESSHLSLYVDGTIQTTRTIGDFTEINECVENLYIGKVDAWNFWGNIDELRIMLGKAVWESNFIIPSEEYDVPSQTGSSDQAHWVRISLLCGDGTTRNINKLGIYPDITVPYLLTGGFNCEWGPVYDQISNYTTIAQNIAPKASILGEDIISIDFEDSDSLTYWTNLISEVTNSNIFSTDFGGEDPHGFWTSVSDNLNSSSSYYNYTSTALQIHLADSENGSIGFYTESVYEDCACEVLFSHSNEVETNRLNTIIRMYAEDGTYYDIRRHQYSTNEQYVVYKNSGWVSYGGFYPDKGLKIEREGSTVRLYTGEPDSWSLRYTYDDQEELAGGAVYFRFLIVKESGYPEVVCTLNSLNVYSLSSSNEEIEWGLVSSDYGNYALGCRTTTVPFEDGPILRHPILENGSKVQSIEFYYYNEGNGGGGISFVDSHDFEILGIGTISPQWVINSGNGWEIVNISPSSGNDGWYRVKATFNWDNANVSIDWEDINASSTFSYTKPLIDDSDVAELRIMGTLGLSWGPDLLDIKFDNITINPSISYLYTFEPSNCITGNLDLQGYENCWGFPSSLEEPTLTFDLGEVYKVDKFVMYSRPRSDNYDHIVRDFDIYSATTLSGTFNLLVSESGFSESFEFPGDNVYELDNPVYMQYVKLVIKDYSKPTDAPSIYVASRDGGGEYITLDGGFVREFQIWQSPEVDMLNSEDHPIICMDLKDQFNLTSHDLEGPGYDDILKENKDWSNENEFFQFSSDITDDPKKVAFSSGYDYSVPFGYTNEYMVDFGGSGVYILEADVFLSSGQYHVQWETYGAIEYESVRILIVGLESQILYNTYISSSWVTQENSFSLNQSDYYTIQVSCSLEGNENSWGVRNIFFKNFDYTSKWVALRRNTATNFVWDTGSYNVLRDNEAGKDYLQYLKIFADGYHRPTEYWWMWETSVSSLENEGVNVKVGRRALKINYPATEAVDYVRFLEGDHFGHDRDFSIKDSLSFWFYIEDIDKLFLEDGGFIFGSIDGYPVTPIGFHTEADYYDDRYNPSANSAYYLWKFRDLSLITGWNYVRLYFDQYNLVSPTPAVNTNKLSKDLDFRNHVTSSFRMLFKGKGQPFYMLLDGLKIERNWYYDEVVYGDHGLCLTWKDYAEIPLSGVDTRYGTVEAWIKLYTDTAGVDHFNNTASRTLFTLVDSANNSISLSIRSSSWFEIGVGDTKKEYKVLFIDPAEVAVGDAAKRIDDVVHIALSWSNDSSRMEGGDTIRLYVNGELHIKGQVTWDVGDSKNIVLRLGGGNTYLANSDNSDGSAIFSNVKFYNYCKTEFELNQQSPPDLDNLTPNDFVQVSSDGVEFYSSKDENLPIEHSLVQPGEKIPVYIRVDKSRIDELDRLTGSINVEWKVPV